MSYSDPDNNFKNKVNMDQTLGSESQTMES